MQTFLLRREFIPAAQIERAIIVPMGIKFIGEGWSVEAPGSWNFIGSAVMDGAPFNEARAQGAAHITLKFECAPPDVVPRSTEANRYPPPTSIMVAANDWSAHITTYHLPPNTAGEWLIKRFRATYAAWGEGCASLCLKGYERGVLMCADVDIPEWLSAIADLDWDVTSATLYKSEQGDLVNIGLHKHGEASLIVELRAQVVCESIRSRLSAPRVPSPPPPLPTRHARDNDDGKSPSRH